MRGTEWLALMGRRDSKDRPKLTLVGANSQYSYQLCPLKVLPLQVTMHDSPPAIGTRHLKVHVFIEPMVQYLK